MCYESIQILNPQTGFRAKLSVGTKFRGFEVLKISKVEPADLELREVLGTYELVLRSPGGVEYGIANNQAPSTHSFCSNRNEGKIDVVPNALEVLTWISNGATFLHPILVES